MINHTKSGYKAGTLPSLDIIEGKFATIGDLTCFRIQNQAEGVERIMMKVTINQEYCKGCYYCIQLCHKGCLSMGNQLNSKGFPFPALVNPEECTGCGACALLCPDFAIEVILD